MNVLVLKGHQKCLSCTHRFVPHMYILSPNRSAVLGSLEKCSRLQFENGGRRSGGEGGGLTSLPHWRDVLA